MDETTNLDLFHTHTQLSRLAVLGAIFVMLGLGIWVGNYLADFLPNKTQAEILNLLSVNPRLSNNHAPQSESVRTHYFDPTLGFQFDYPPELPVVSAGKANDEIAKVVHIEIDSQKITKITPNAVHGFDAETLLRDRALLTKNTYGEELDTPLPESEHVTAMEVGYAKEYTVFARNDPCTITFERTLLFYHSESVIRITLVLPRDAAIDAFSTYFVQGKTRDGNQGSFCWKKTNNSEQDTQKELVAVLKKGQGPKLAQEWYDLFDQITPTVDIVQTKK